MRKLWYISRFGDSALLSQLLPRKLAVPTRAPTCLSGMSNELLQYILGGSTNVFFIQELGKNTSQDVYARRIFVIKISIKQPDFFMQTMQTILHFSDVKWNYLEYLRSRVFFIHDYMHDSKEDDKL